MAHLADLQERRNDAADGAKSYQRALRLDTGLTDRRSAAADWFNYGQFLLHEKQSEQLAFACFLKAEQLLQSIPGEELTQVTKTREQIEAQLGRDARTIRKHAEAVAQEALALPGSAFKTSP